MGFKEIKIFYSKFFGGVKSNLSLIYFLTFILAFCSIVYELLLAQSLTAFLENTVLRYSITIGLYMFSMGYGALIAEKKLVILKYNHCSCIHAAG